MPSPAASSTIEERLASAGYLAGPRGSVILCGAAADLFSRLPHALRRVLDASSERLIAPPLIDRRLLETAGYLAHFPHQVVIAGGGRRKNTGQPLTPAACLHLYGKLAGQRLPTHPISYFVSGPCSRFEAGRFRFPFRLLAFHMTEMVVIGGADEIDAHAGQMEQRLGGLFAAWRIDGSFATATDSFFAPTARGARVLQHLKQLKREFRCEIDGLDLALVSINRHEDYFARRFKIRLAGTPETHSLCAAVGLERMVAAGVLTWGADPTGWPAEFRA
jgi:seryl-tRNA synthetase